MTADEGTRATNAPIFIVGCPRSGTTLLRDLMRAHPRLTFPSESHFIPSFYRVSGNPATDRAAVDLARRILRLEWVTPWRLPLTPSDFASDRTFAAVLDRLYGAWAGQEEKPRWGDKTPHYVLHIPTLLEIFPDAKILHIVRDGRDVALSWLRTRMEPRNLFTAAASWKRHVTAGLDAAQMMATERVLEVRYEALVGAPGATLDTVYAFVGESFTPDMLRLNRLPREFQPRYARRRGLPPHKMEIDQTNVGVWKKKDMSVDDRALFEAVAGDLLERLGYEVEGFGRRVGAPERLYWDLHHRFWWTMRRLRVWNARTWLRTEIELRSARWLARRSG